MTPENIWFQLMEEKSNIEYWKYWPHMACIYPNFVPCAVSFWSQVIKSEQPVKLIPSLLQVSPSRVLDPCNPAHVKHSTIWYWCNFGSGGPRKGIYVLGMTLNSSVVSWSWRWTHLALTRKWYCEPGCNLRRHGWISLFTRTRLAV